MHKRTSVSHLSPLELEVWYNMSERWWLTVVRDVVSRSVKMHLYFLLCTSAPTERIRARAKAFLSASWVIIVQQFSRREGQHDVTRGRKRGAALRVPRAHKSVYYNNVVSGHSRSLLREMGTQERALSFNREDSRGETPLSFSKTIKALKGFKALTHKLFQKIGCKSKIVVKIQSNIACKIHREGKP